LGYRRDGEKILIKNETVVKSPRLAVPGHDSEASKEEAHAIERVMGSFQASAVVDSREALLYFFVSLETVNYDTCADFKASAECFQLVCGYDAW
jgi:hypothetical protein